MEEMNDFILTDDVKVEKAARLIKEYCIKHPSCDGCVLCVHINNIPRKCKVMITDCGDVCPPLDWEV